MSKRKLKRQLSLVHLVMLGSIGTLGAQIFVLTGEAAAITGPAALLALLVAGLLTYNIAANYCELATSYPETGGAMTYVREAYGSGLLSFLVGSMDCLSSTFLAGLTAVAFGYSLNILFPFIPIVPAAIFILVAFSVLNIVGVSMVGKVQTILGIIQLVIFGIYLVAGFTSPNGFHWSTLTPNGQFFIYPDAWTNFAKLLRTIALIYIAYVGFEVIADDAEEAKDPDRALPQAFFISVTVVIIINMLMVSLVLGTIPWYELAGSKTVLTDTVARFIPGWGVILMAFCGVETMLTTINSSMLSATREAFTLSRDGVWPKILSRLSRRRTPYVAIILVGLSSVLVSATGLVDFLSYISSSGYMFVLFWASLAMIRLRKKYPDMRRPFKVPFFPLTAYLAAGTAVLIVVFTEVRSLLFGAGLLSVLALLRYAGPPISDWMAVRFKPKEPNQDRILISAASPATIESLTHLAAIITRATQDNYICVMSVISPGPEFSMESARWLAKNIRAQKLSVMNQLVERASTENIPLYTKLRAAPTVSEGILEEIEGRSNVRLLLAGWPGRMDAQALAENPVKIVLQKARTNVAVVLDRGLRKVQHILVPVGGGPHSRMALRLAYEIAEAEGARITALRVLTAEAETEEAGTEEAEDQTSWLGEVVEEAVLSVPECFTLRVTQAATAPEGILAEATQQPYDLIVIGASEEWQLDTRLFGGVDDWIAEHAPCSVVLCRRYESTPMAWLRYQIKRMEHEYDQDDQPEMYESEDDQVL